MKILLQDIIEPFNQKSFVYRIEIVFKENKPSFKTTTHKIVNIDKVCKETNSASVYLNDGTILLVKNGEIVNEISSNYYYVFKVEEKLANEIILDDACQSLARNYCNFWHNRASAVNFMVSVRRDRFNTKWATGYYRTLDLRQKYHIGTGYNS